MKSLLIATVSVFVNNDGGKQQEIRTDMIE